MVTLPARLTLGEGFDAVLERELSWTARVTQPFSHASSLVRAALESKQPLLEGVAGRAGGDLMRDQSPKELELKWA